MKKYIEFITENDEPFDSAKYAHTALWWSCIVGYNKGSQQDFDRIQKMINDDPEIVNNVNSQTKDTALIISYKLDLVKYLISHGAKLNVQGAGGDTALIRAAKKMDGPKMRTLIEKNAIMEIKDDKDKTFFDYLPNDSFGRNFKEWVAIFRPQYGRMKQFDL